MSVCEEGVANRRRLGEVGCRTQGSLSRLAFCECTTRDWIPVILALGFNSVVDRTITELSDKLTEYDEPLGEMTIFSIVAPR